MIIYDFQIDTLTGDLAIVSGDLVVINDPRDAVAQDISQALKTYFGEWFLDQDIGVPYFQQILVKNPDGDVVDGVLKRAIANRSGVLSILSWDLNYNNAVRQLSLKATIQTYNGVINFKEVIV